MVGELFIDNIDVYQQYGIGIEEDGYRGLVQFQSMRTPPMNNWPEEHGIEVDLSDPKLHNKTINITFYGTRDTAMREFVDFLDEQVYHIVEIRNIGLTRTLRLTKMLNRNTVGEYKTCEMEFCDDDYPFDGYTRPALIPIAEVWQSGIDIDGIPLSDYGIWFTEGERDEILIVGDIKKALTIDVISRNGVIYDNGASVLYGDRDIMLNLSIVAPQATFWNNWNAFFYDLTRPNERELYYNVREDTYKFFYKSCTVNRFEQTRGNEIFCSFSVTFNFTAMTLADIYYLLAVERYGLVELDDTALMVDTSLNPVRNPS